MVSKSLMLVVALAACQPHAPDPLGPSPTGGTNGASGVSASLCPNTPPADGASCTDFAFGSTCTWGDDPRFGCRTFAACTGSSGSPAWLVQTRSCATAQAACPDSAPPMTDPSACTAFELGLTCVYAPDVFTCAQCNGNLCFGGTPTYRWFVSTTLSAECPSAPPNMGDLCATESLVCDYNGCADVEGMPWVSGVVVICTSGAWTQRTGFACP